MVSKKEGSSILCLVAGVSLVSVCLSLICVVQVFFIVPQHCSCITSDGNTEPFVASNDGKNGAIPSREDVKDHEWLQNVSTTTKKAQQASLSDLEYNSQEKLSRKRRWAADSISGTSNRLSILQQQVFFLESRFRNLQQEVNRRRTLRGPKGNPGNPGAPGRDGIDGRQGRQGAMGPPGSPGSQGKTGLRGEMGQQGSPGVNGLPGLPGLAGAKGDKGEPGERGLQGFKGAKGFRGYRGQVGYPGDRGPMGPPGRTGMKGSKGSVDCYETQRGTRYRVSCSAMSQQPNQADEENKPSGGFVYTRWGRTTCPSGGAKRVYSGQAAATRHETGRAGGSRFTCLPNKPWYYRPPTTPSGNLVTRRPPLADILKWKVVYGTNFFLTCVTCVVKTRSLVLMIPARKECYGGWVREYDGYLAVQINHQDHKDVICVDKTAQGILRDTDYVRGMASNCNTLSCPPYTDNQRLPCVVCSM